MALTRRLAEALKGVEDPLLNTLRKTMYAKVKDTLYDCDFLYGCFYGDGLASGVEELELCGSAALPLKCRTPGDMDINIYGSERYDSDRALIGMARVAECIASNNNWEVLELGVREAPNIPRTGRGRSRAERRSSGWKYLVKAEAIQRFYFASSFSPEDIRYLINEGEEGAHHLNKNDVVTLQSTLDGNRFKSELMEHIGRVRADRCQKNGSLAEYEAVSGSKDSLLVQAMLDTSSKPPPRLFPSRENFWATEGMPRLVFREPIHELIMLSLIMPNVTGTRELTREVKRHYDTCLRLPNRENMTAFGFDDKTVYSHVALISPDSPLFLAATTLLLAAEPTMLFASIKKGSSFPFAEELEAPFLRETSSYSTPEEYEKAFFQLSNNNIVLLHGESYKQVAKSWNILAYCTNLVAKSFVDMQSVKDYLGYCIDSDPWDIDMETLAEHVLAVFEEYKVEDAEQYVSSFTAHISARLQTNKMLDRSNKKLGPSR